MDCGALPEGLMENELFGHCRGAFTGAHMKQKGLVAMAEGGTLFLDEVDSLSLAAQSKLLRLLQERTYRPLGAEQFCRSNARVIAATNRSLEEYLKEGKFRQDLYYRLDVLHLHLPALRERKNDIALLARRYLWSLPGDQNQPRKILSQSAIRKLENHDWPGNVRELFNVLQRAAVFSARTEIGPDDINLPQASNEAADKCKLFRSARALAIERFERAYIIEVLRRHEGNITRAAMEAGKDRRAFGRLVSKYQIDRGHPI
jgi:two-component system response regulator GlrR